MSDETIHIEEEETKTEAEAKGSTWSEEFNVTSQELMGFLNKVVQEASVRRIVIKNEKLNVHLDIPILLGVGAIALLPMYAALGLIVAIVADFKIIVTRTAVDAPQPEPDAEVKSA